MAGDRPVRGSPCHRHRAERRALEVAQRDERNWDEFLGEGRTKKAARRGRRATRTGILGPREETAPRGPAAEGRKGEHGTLAPRATSSDETKDARKEEKAEIGKQWEMDGQLPVATVVQAGRRGESMSGGGWALERCSKAQGKGGMRT